MQATGVVKMRVQAKLFTYRKEVIRVQWPWPVYEHSTTWFLWLFRKTRKRQCCMGVSIGGRFLHGPECPKSKLFGDGPGTYEKIIASYLEDWRKRIDARIEEDWQSTMRVAKATGTNMPEPPDNDRATTVEDTFIWEYR